MKKFQLWPWLALACGCGAFLLRWAQLRLGFEAGTGLPVPGDPWGVVLPLLLAALAILFLVLSRGAPAGVTAEASLGRAFPVEKSLLPLLGGLLWLVSGAFQMMDAGSPEPVESFDSAFAASLSRGAMIAGILTVLSAVCLFCTLSPSPREGRRAEPNAVPLLGAGGGSRGAAGAALPGPLHGPLPPGLLPAPGGADGSLPGALLCRRLRLLRRTEPPLPGGGRLGTGPLPGRGRRRRPLLQALLPGRRPVALRAAAPPCQVPLRKNRMTQAPGGPPPGTFFPSRKNFFGFFRRQGLTFRQSVLLY